MKKLITFLFFGAVLMFVASCNKNDNTNPNPNPNPTPTTPTASTPALSNVSGGLVSVKIKYTYTNSIVPTPITMEFQTAVASFFTSPGATTYVDAGAVAVNTYNLDKSSNNAYTKIALTGQTPSTLDFENGSSWNVGGSSGVTAFTYNHTTAFPAFTGSLPTSVTKANGFTINIAANTTNADSVIVLIAAGSGTVIKTVAAGVTSVTFSSAELSSLPVVSDNSAIIQVDPWKYTVVNKNGKDYAFIKEQANISTLNIN